jgi:polygalacturonase
MPSLGLPGRRPVGFLLALAIVAVVAVPPASGQPGPARMTSVSIAGDAFLINGKPTLEGRTWRGYRVEGLLPNSRMVQGVFDDQNQATRSRWAYGDTKTWDAARNTREFVAAMREWRRRGLLAFTLNLQGGSPEGYSKEQPWHNSAFEADGSLKADCAARLEQILDEADRQGMVVILGLFYFGQDERLRDEAAVIHAVDGAVKWVLGNGYRNVVIEIDNEADIEAYDHAILKPARVAELIERVKRTTVDGRRLLVSTSFRGDRVPGADVVRASDFVLLHGNGVTNPDRIAEMVAQVRKTPGFTARPIVFNEDDHYDFERPWNNVVAATSAHASWGFFDFRRAGEQENEGYQSVPVNWGISSVRKRAFFDLVAEMSGAAAAPASRQVLDPASLVANLPFAMPAVALPDIPARTVRITDHGARGDGATLNTDAIAAAIEACARAGGGRVIVPRGIYLTGPIELKSRIDLHLERGAVLLFSPRIELYPLVRTSFEGARGVRARSPIWADKAEDVAITGEGLIDGSGQAWRPVKQSKTTGPQWRALVASGGVVEGGSTWWPSAEAARGAELLKSLSSRADDAPLADYAAAREFLRPVMISLVECRRVLLDGPTFQNSPAWNIHPMLCEDLVIRNVTVLNPWYSQNGDGVDVDSCRRVVVQNCRFDVGDDAICVKSGKDEYGRRRGRPTEDMVVVDNVVYHGHGGFTIGSEMSGGVRNVLVERCTFLGTDVGLRFKTARGRGGVVERIWVRDVQMKDIPTDAIGFNMYYGGEAPTDPAGSEATGSRPPKPVDEGTPQFRDIVLSRITCRGADRAVMLEGLPEMPIRGIVLEDVRISARTGLTTVDADAITLRGVEILPSTGPVIAVRDSRAITVEGGAAPSGTPVFLKVDGAGSRDIRVVGVDLTRAKTPVEKGPAVADDAVTIRERD